MAELSTIALSTHVTIVETLAAEINNLRAHQPDTHYLTERVKALEESNEALAHQKEELSKALADAKSAQETAEMGYAVAVEQLASIAKDKEQYLSATTGDNEFAINTGSVVVEVLGYFDVDSLLLNKDGNYVVPKQALYHIVNALHQANEALNQERQRHSYSSTK